MHKMVAQQGPAAASAEGKDIPSAQQIKDLSSVIETIHEINSKFLDMLEQLTPIIESKDDENMRLGPAFSEMSESFKFYSAYINFYEKRYLLHPERRWPQRVCRTNSFPSLVLCSV